MRRCLPIALSIALTLIVSAFDAAPARPDVQNPNHERGFAPDKAFAFGDIDNVNLFNGGLTLALPLGPRYPLGGGLSYGLNLVYNANAWQWEVWCPSESTVCHNKSFANPDDNAGFGWQLNPGMLIPPATPRRNTSDLWMYVGPDGADHLFWATLHDGEALQSGVSYSRDGSYLRMRTVTGGREVDFPDGTIHRFDTAGRLIQIKSRFPSATSPASWVNFAWSFDTGTPSVVQTWTLTDSAGRTQTVHFTRFTVDGQAVAMVSSVVLAGFNNTTSTYTFTYGTKTFARPQDPDDNASNITLQFLTGITLPGGSSFSMPLASYGFQGELNAMTLPTLGKLGWTFTQYSFPSLDPPKGPFDPLHDPTTESRGVSFRRLYHASGTLLGEWQYSQGLFPAASRTILTDPLGHRSEHHFQGDPNLRNYSLPYTEATTDGTSPPRFLSSQVFASGSATPLRSTYVRYEWDKEYLVDPTGSEPRYDLDRRVVSERTVYHDDGDKFADTTFSNFDGLGHYRTNTTGGSFGAGNVRTLTANYNPAQGSYPHLGVGSTFVQLASTAAWVLDTYDTASESEGGVIATRQACFETSTGFLLRERILNGTAPGVHDVLRVFARDTQGNLTDERDFGGDLQSLVTSGTLCSLALPAGDVYRMRHTYQFGSLASSQYRTVSDTAMSFFSLDQTIDKNTGLPSIERDTAGLATNLEYDALGRLTWIKPAASVTRDGWTQFVYTHATAPSALAKVGIKSFANNQSTGTPLAESEMLFDALGRIWQERTKLPGNIWSTRETLYDAHGWKTSVSEAESSTSPPHKTRFNLYDPFGRPAEMVPPDGTAHKVTFWYSGPQNRTRLVKVGTSQSAGAVSETTVQIAETYDRQGRLWKVTEDSGAGNQNQVTQYFYDVGGRLSRVQQTRPEGTQNRFFTYDRRGFLTSEQHPEKGSLGNGTVSYLNYDAHGHALRVLDGPDDHTFTYDRAERLTQVRETGGLARLLTELTYATANGASDWRNGKLLTAVRHNYHERWGVDFRVAETYTYGGREGRVSQKRSDVNVADNYTQSFIWDALGNLFSQTYPTCGHCPVGVTVPARTIPYTYSQGLLTAIPGWATSITYHPNGLVNQVTHANGLTWNQANDPNAMARPASITVKTGTTSLFSTGTYAYDGAGNVVKAGSDYYLYDRFNRLVEGTVFQAGASRRQTYGYDGFSNLTSITTWVSGVPTTRTNATVATTNRLSAASYDAAGRQLNWGTYTYTWNPDGMLKALQGSGDDWAYAYSADDQRVLSYNASTGESTFRLRDLDGRIVREFRYSPAGGWRWEKDWIHRGSQVLATTSASAGTTYLHPDHLGTPRLIAGSTGAIQATFHYYPYGEQAAATGVTAEVLKFTGHERDANGAGTTDDLDYMHARYCNPMVGRFLSPDGGRGWSTGSPQSWNLFTYAQSNPVKYIDANGEYIETPVDAIILLVDVGIAVYEQATTGKVSGITKAAIGADMITLATPGVAGGGVFVRIGGATAHIAEEAAVGARAVQVATKAGQVSAALADTVKSAPGASGTSSDAENSSENLSPEARRGIASLEKQISEHQDKLAAYRRDPEAFDNKGFLKNAPSEPVRQQIIDSRIRNLEKQIRTFQDQLERLRGGS